MSNCTDPKCRIKLPLSQNMEQLQLLCTCACVRTRGWTHTHILSLMHTSIHIPTIASAKFGHNPGTLPWLVRSWGKNRSNEWKAAGTARCISLPFQQWCGEGKTHAGATTSLAQKWTVNKVKEAFKLVSGLNHFSTPQNSSKQGEKKTNNSGHQDSRKKGGRRI